MKHRSHTFRQCFPKAVLLNRAAYDKDGPEAFFQLFGKEWDNCGRFEPVLLALNYSHYGEQAESYGLLLKDQVLFEVHGSECSVWEFNGQWDPEPVTPEDILYRIRFGELGKGEGKADFATELETTVCALMQGDDTISYLTADDEQRLAVYSLPIPTHERCQDLNYLSLEDIFGPLIAKIPSNGFTFTAEAIDQFTQTFSENQLVGNRYDVGSHLTYCFKKNEVCLFLLVSGDNRISLRASAPTDEQHKAVQLAEIIEDVALSLLMSTNLFHEHSRTRKCQP